MNRMRNDKIQRISLCVKLNYPIIGRLVFGKSDGSAEGVGFNNDKFCRKSLIIMMPLL